MKYFFLSLTMLLIVLSNTSYAQFTASSQQYTVNEYLSNGGFENSIAGFKAYKNTAQALPVNGTGGTPATTIVSSLSSPLAGKASGLLTHTAANLQGEGFSTSFVLDSASKGKVITISGVYQITSGTYSGGTSSTDSDVEVYIYDVDAAQLIQPAGFKLDGGASGISYDINATFQSNISSSNYRLIFHYPNTTATAFTLKIDKLSIKQQYKSQGPPNTPSQNFTPSFLGGGSATYSNQYCNWRRDADEMVIACAQSIGTAGSGSSSLTLTIPNGYQIDLAKTTASSLSSRGSGTFYNTTNRIAMLVGVDDSTHLNFSNDNASAAIIGANLGSGFFFSFVARVPIVGWTTSATTSDSADTRVVALSVYSTSGPSTVTSGNPIIFTSPTIKDTHGAYNSSTGRYTAPVSGWYQVSVGFDFTSFSASAILSYVNGSNVSGAQIALGGAETGPTSFNGSQLLFLNAGDVFDPRPSATPTTVGNNGGWLNILRISGPSQIAASESVNALYTATPPAGTVTSSFSTITYGTKIKDSHNAYSGGVYTVPVSGVYDISAQTAINATFTSGQNAQISVFIDGVEKYSQAPSALGSGAQLFISVSPKSVPLLAGQQITIRVQTNGASPSLSSYGPWNYFSISRSGN